MTPQEYRRWRADALWLVLQPIPLVVEYLRALGTRVARPPAPPMGSPLLAPPDAPQPRQGRLARPLRVQGGVKQERYGGRYGQSRTDDDDDDAA